MRKLLTRYLALVLVVLLCGCASSPYAGDGKQRSDALLREQVHAARQGLAQAAPPRVIYAGFALNSQSKAFRNDVLLAEKAARLADPQAIVFRLGNPAFGDTADWPFATRENVEAVLHEIGTLARPQDKVLILLTSHGSPNVLHVNANNTGIGAITPAELAQWMGGLRGKPTLLVVSSCYSGSFLEPLRDPARIILTASARDRTSFGCQFHSHNTFFVEELWGQKALAGLPVTELMSRAREGVQRRETALKVKPSLPQSDVGPSAEAWARQPWARWMTNR